MQARMPNPALVLPQAMPAILGVFEAAKTGGVPESTLELVHLRVSQINGCSACVDAGWRTARKSGVSDERLFAVAAWREARSSPTRNAPRWPLPSPRRVSRTTAATPYRTMCGMPPRTSTTRRGWLRWCW